MKDRDGWCNLIFLFASEKLDDFDFRCRRFQELLQKQRDLVDNDNWTVLMYLCYCKPQLLNYDWAVELVQRLGGKVDNNGSTALIQLFIENPEKTDFNSNGFKLLWENEKNIKVDELKKDMRRNKQIKEMIVTAIPDAEQYFDNNVVPDDYSDSEGVQI